MNPEHAPESATMRRRWRRAVLLLAFSTSALVSAGCGGDEVAPIKQEDLPPSQRRFAPKGAPSSKAGKAEGTRPSARAGPAPSPVVPVGLTLPTLPRIGESPWLASMALGGLPAPASR